MNALFTGYTVNTSAGQQVSFIQPGNDPTVALTITQNVSDDQERCICIYEVLTSFNTSSGSNSTNHGPQIPEVISYSGDASIIELGLTVAVDLVANEIYSAAIAISSEGNSITTVEFSESSYHLLLSIPISSTHNFQVPMTFRL